jgi:uncharacterized protein
MRLVPCISLVFFACVSLSAIPEAPSMRKTLTFDAAKLISDADRRAIHACQLQAFKEQDVAIVVVTISSMGRYIEGAHEVKDFAGKWFAKWRIGKEQNGRGILFLVSRHDRKVRIELGQDWGGQWDPHCARVLKSHVLPAFKSGRYSKGIKAGVQELATIAAIGPSGQPPSAGIAAGFADGDLLGAASRNNPIPMRYRIWVLGLGVLLCLIGLFHRDGRWLLLGVGGLFICSVYAFWAAVVLLVLFLLIADAPNGRDEYYYCGGRRRRRRRRSSCSGSSSSSGGSWGGGGGFSSSGGGASGSW